MCTNVITTHKLTHTHTHPHTDNVSTLVLPNGISGQAYDYTQLSEVVSRWLPSAPQPMWQSYRKHNEAIRFAERSLKASCTTGWVSTTHVLMASKAFSSLMGSEIPPCAAAAGAMHPDWMASWMVSLMWWLFSAGALSRVFKIMWHF